MDQKSVDQKLERAVKLHNAGKLDAAAALYREILRDAPGHQTALHLSGLIAHQRGYHREAVSLIEMAIAGGASTAAIYTNCGIAYRALGELDLAARRIGWAIALDPEFAEAHLNYALVLLDQGLARAAATHLEIVRELQPDSSLANFLLGRIRLDEDNLAQATERLRDAARLKPDHAEAHFLLARALLAQGDTRGALTSLSQTLALAPEHAFAARLAAKCSFELRAQQAAFDHLQSTLPAGMRPAAARLGQVDLWCAARDAAAYTRLARPQWLQLPQPKALPEEDSRHFALPKPYALEIFVARLPQVRVLPKELLLLSADDRLFLDGFVRNAQQYALREQGAIRHCSDDGRLLLALPARKLAVKEPCVWIGAGSGHFQWMFESLARLWEVEQLPQLAQLPLVVQDALSPWQTELLDMLGYDASRRIEVPAEAMLECACLHAASLVSVGQFISPMAIQHLRRELLRRVPASTAAPRRIYLSRAQAATRRLANEAELLPLLEAHGFAVVHPERLSATQQLALFQSAECILGVEGAAFANLVVVPAQAKVGVIVARGLFDPRHFYVSAPIGHDFTYLCAEPDFGSHATLAECDVALAREVLEGFLARG